MSDDIDSIRIATVGKVFADLLAGFEDVGHALNALALAIRHGIIEVREGATREILLEGLNDMLAAMETFPDG